MINEPFGWLWILAGFGSGMGLGLFFGDEAWLGGYGSHRRRLIRLGHVSFVGLGILNILFSHSTGGMHLEAGWLAVASWALVAGGVTMPLCCGLTAWRPALKAAFAVPVLCLLLGATVVTAGMLWP
ncbi:MAG: hypothetical protein ACYS0G_07890 [Planctomycetota bacterium]|jgi:hypothetical protein